MDNPWIAYSTTFVLATMILYTSRRIIANRRSGLPPGRLGWPYIGETLEFISCAYSPLPESFMNKRRLLYGKVFKSHILGSPTIVSTDAEVSRFVLQSDAKLFVPSYPRSLTELMGKSSILLINGSLQRRVHGLIGAFFKSPNLKSQITQDMQKYVQEAMDSWKDEQIIYIQDEAKSIAFQILVKALISLDPGEEMEFLKQQFQEFIAGLISLPVKLPGTRLYESLQAKKRMVKLVQKIIEERRKAGTARTPRDVVDVLLNDASEQLTVDLISDNMIDLMIPGEDSVPVLMTLAIKYLSDCPLALQQLMEENMRLKKRKHELGEPFSWGDYMSLSFTQNIITETLRMGNIIIGVMRKAMKDVTVKGYLIPKGWCVFTYFRSVHLDEQLYECPYEFNPWRWQDKDVGTCNFTPFGGGQRLCPGVDLARLEASIFLHHLVTTFTCYESYQWGPPGLPRDMDLIGVHVPHHMDSDFTIIEISWPMFVKIEEGDRCCCTLERERALCNDGVTKTFPHATSTWAPTCQAFHASMRSPPQITWAPRNSNFRASGGPSKFHGGGPLTIF